MCESKQVEKCIEYIIDEFVKNPYLHRVEHSLHCEIYKILENKLIENNIITNRLGFKVCLIQKEWPHPENIDNSRRRGNYDLVILGYDSLINSTLNNYLIGKNIEINTAIEVGLNYSIKHLEKDCETLSKTNAKNKIIIHLKNKHSRKTEIVLIKRKVNDCIEKYTDISFYYAWVILDEHGLKIIDKEIKERFA